jgi:hypothetical protein
LIDRENRKLYDSELRDWIVESVELIARLHDIDLPPKPVKPYDY